MKPLYWGILGAIVLLLAVYVGWDYFDAPATPTALVQQALTAGSLEDRKYAAVKLTAFKDSNILVPNLQQVAKETQDPEVLEIAIKGLSTFYDAGSMPLYIAALTNPNKDVRQAGLDAVQGFYDGYFPANLEYDVDYPPEKRAEVASKLKAFFEHRPGMKK
jgi:hypothetical protein